MLQSVRATVHFDDIASAPPEQRLDFLREARDALRLNRLPCGCPLSVDGVSLLQAYVDELAVSLRPRVVVDEMAVA